MTPIPLIPLSNESIPQIGFGTWTLRGIQCTRAVASALQLGYRHIDTAEFYQNEAEVAQAIKQHEVPREELFITTKLWGTNASKHDAVAACRASLKRLDTDYVDLYLLHYYVDDVPLEETFSAFQQILDEGLAKRVGVSNFNVAQLQEALGLGVPLATNQIEFHPYLNQEELLAFCNSKNIPITAYSPVARGRIFQDPVLKEIAYRHQKTVAQVSLRWLIQKGCVVIPKASNPQHQNENLDVLDFDLSKEEMTRIDALGNEKKLRLVPLG